MHIDIRQYETVTSTMDVCRELALAGAAEGVLVAAGEQTAGRGRSAHAWYSPGDRNVYASLLLRPRCAPQRLGLLTMAGAVAVVDAVHALWPGAQDVGIKWFNDVHLQGRKLAGVLVETAFTGERVDYAIIGIGLNLNCDFKRAPEALRTMAISLSAASGTTFDVATALRVIVQRLIPLCAMLNEDDHRDILDRYRAHSITLGRQVCITRDGVQHTGLARAINADGTLVIERATGDLVAFRP